MTVVVVVVAGANEQLLLLPTGPIFVSPMLYYSVFVFSARENAGDANNPPCC